MNVLSLFEKMKGDRDMTERKMYCLNEDGVGEYFIATSADKALEFAAQTWGIRTVLEAARYFFQGNPDTNENDFIAYFVREVSPEQDFRLELDTGEVINKKVSEWLAEEGECPRWFAAENY